MQICVSYDKQDYDFLKNKYHNIINLIKQAGFAEPHSVLTIGWVGLGLVWGWVGDGSH